MEYLAITAIAPDQKKLMENVFKLAAKHECNVKDSRVMILGEDIASIILLAGNWSAIAKIESALPKLAEKENLYVHLKRTKPKKYENDHLPYLVQIIAIDNPGLVYDVSHFFTLQDIQINDLQTNPFAASHSGTEMVTMLMSVGVPTTINISDLRERFMLMCDELNIDGIMEPEKH